MHTHGVVHAVIMYGSTVLSDTMQYIGCAAPGLASQQRQRRLNKQALYATYRLGGLPYGTSDRHWGRSLGNRAGGAKGGTRKKRRAKREKIKMEKRRKGKGKRDNPNGTGLPVLGMADSQGPLA